MLSQNAFMSLTKPEAYKLYADLYQKVDEKDSIITKFITTATEKLQQLTTEMAPKKLQENQTVKLPNKKVRSFQNFPVKEGTCNLVLGSSVVKKLAFDKTLPKDTEVHGYSGSTTLEKIEVLSKYQAVKLKSCVIQDGTNAILKHSSMDVASLFQDFEKLVTMIEEKFEPDQLVLMEVPPIRAKSSNNMTNERIDQFNKMLRQYSDGKSLKVLPLNEILKNMGNYNSLYYDDLHFNYEQGLPFLKNCLLLYILQTSNGMVPTRQQSSFKQWHRKQPNNNWKQSYNYLHGY